MKRNHKNLQKALLVGVVAVALAGAGYLFAKSQDAEDIDRLSRACTAYDNIIREHIGYDTDYFCETIAGSEDWQIINGIN